MIILRRGPKRPEVQLRFLLENLARLTEAIDEGCVIVLEQTRIRVRRLPLGGVEKGT